MPNPELERKVRHGIYRILVEHGDHLDFADRIAKLRKEKLGREVHAKIQTEHERTIMWPVGIILPLKYDNTRHAVLLANNRVILVEAPTDLEAQDRYKEYMQPQDGPIYWPIPENGDLSHIETSFKNSLNLFDSQFIKAGSSSEQIGTVEWAINIARTMKNGHGRES